MVPTNEDIGRIEHALRLAQNEIDRAWQSRRTSRYIGTQHDPYEVDDLLTRDLVVRARQLARALQELLAWQNDRPDPPPRGRKAHKMALRAPRRP